MWLFKGRRPTPALILAFIALVAALSGTAVALPGKNTIDSGDIKKGQVKNSDIGKNAITGSKVKNNSLKGADVLESSLGQVPSAASANTASNATQLGGVAASAYAKSADILHATVDTTATGATIVRGRGATAAGRLAVGVYYVTFNRDVSKCTWNASAGRSTATGTSAFIATPRGVPSPGGVKDAGVVIWNGNGAGVPQVDGASFFMTITC
jgi:hypothetical protein